jgi:hypothetical protein
VGKNHEITDQARFEIEQTLARLMIVHEKVVRILRAVEGGDNSGLSFPAATLGAVVHRLSTIRPLPYDLLHAAGTARQVFAQSDETSPVQPAALALSDALITATLMFDQDQPTARTVLCKAEYTIDLAIEAMEGLARAQGVPVPAPLEQELPSEPEPSHNQIRLDKMN